ncbi:phosphatidylglycerol lysyltransferase domain-containing protein [Ureaplasma diversum]|uniref:Phosphatidylglycerol lysyltransferase C-terminal domain-containing protein n=1 Tax=Ureaplasma diversum NCTC 246 TaxID=1188241 RepID=A0A084EYA1_9BACT|nr:phosphatidylglycerol lysyltransferase domain-containing protein [Ureaplasma diversum]KEZ22943.1 hypothetical protein UDIV_4390 [Ureaplasma diversum NCTC 246]
MYQQLSWTNYEQLEELRLKINPNSYTSTLSLLTWSYYGFDIFYEYDQELDVIFFYGRGNLDLKQIESSYTFNKFYNKYFTIFTIYDPKKHELSNIVIEAKMRLKHHFKDQYVNVHGAILFSDYEQYGVCLDHISLYAWVTNYIYVTQDLKTFKGKALQKKRNNLNYFIKNHLDDYELVNYKPDKHIDLVLDFLEQWKAKTVQRAESLLINANLDLIKNTKNKPDFKGSVLFKKATNEVVGFTLVYTRPEIAEILIEQTDRTIRGMYQYLLSTNLINNEINHQLIDRQDGASSSAIINSKRSYVPLYEIKRISVQLKE